jgi:hypothetical protein
VEIEVPQLENLKLALEVDQIIVEERVEIKKEKIQKQVISFIEPLKVPYKPSYDFVMNEPKKMTKKEIELLQKIDKPEDENKFQEIVRMNEVFQKDILYMFEAKRKLEQLTIEKEFGDREREERNRVKVTNIGGP